MLHKTTGFKLEVNLHHDSLLSASHLESSSDEDDRDDETESLQEDVNLPSTSRGLPDSKQGDSEGVPTPGWNTTPGVALGQWEEHTRGIGSRLMAKMGYEYGYGKTFMHMSVVVGVLSGHVTIKMYN